MRVGNAAAEQRQNDLMGELVLCLETLLTDPRIVDEDSGRFTPLLQRLVEEAIEAAPTKDTSIWEFRSLHNVYTFSRAMCWVAIDRGASLAHRLGRMDLAEKWRPIADSERDEVLRRGFSEKLGYFTQALDGQYPDASLLLLPTIGIIDARDPRFVATVDAYEKHLVSGGLMRRYVSHDDFGETHSAFTICSFWWAEALALMGRLDRAIEVFEMVTRHANPVGLFSEDIDPETGRAPGQLSPGLHARGPHPRGDDDRRTPRGPRRKGSGLDVTAQRLLLVSNRLPVTVKLERGEIAVPRSAGGLATGLRGPHEQSGGLWIGWPGDVSRMSDGQRRKLDAHLAELRCVPVYLSGAEVSRYYDGFSNAVLWPLFHYLLDRIPPHSQEWEVYRAVNEKFAEAVARVWRPGDLIWVHDYQLSLVPRMLRTRIPGATIGFFLHIPFPASEVLRILPWREQILEGMLGADLIGFHTFTYRSHFASSVLRILGISTPGDRIFVDGREIRLGVFPIGVDAQTFGKLAEDPEVLAEVASIRDQARGERILLGIDRLDYTKGIPRRLLAYERLLEREPHWRGKVRLIQVAVPSRDKVPSYQEFRRTGQRARRAHQRRVLVRRLGAHPLRAPVAHREARRRALPRRRRDARHAPSRRDEPRRQGVRHRPPGRRRRARAERVRGRRGRDGRGAAGESRTTSRRCPQALSDALRMPEEERKLRMRSLRQRIASRDVHHWAQSFIDALGSTRAAASADKAPLSSPADLAALAARLRSAERLVLLLDYDGTLVPFARSPDLAAPDRPLRDLLGGARRQARSARSRGQRAAKRTPRAMARRPAHRAPRRARVLVAHVAGSSVGRHEGRERRVEARGAKDPRHGDRGDARRPRRREDGEPGLALPHGGAGARRDARRRALASTRAGASRHAGRAAPRREGDRGAPRRRDEGARRGARARADASRRFRRSRRWATIGPTRTCSSRYRRTRWRSSSAFAPRSLATASRRPARPARCSRPSSENRDRGPSALAFGR